jgi:GalNAc-alpha-(1->4)-GalNAc-alpha-(1->3)-diNAcBac-PP-undecaprenol alpha-1,4-N-acetyl-D-galactosaminyltransferase
VKILFLVSSLGAGGAERVSTALANAWSQRGDEVILMPTYSGRGECFYSLLPGVRLVYLADVVSRSTRTPFGQFVRLVALRRFIVAERPDVIVSFLSNVNVAAVLAAAGLGIPVILSERIDPFEEKISSILRLFCRLTYPFADALVVQTIAVAEKYNAAGRAFRKLRVIANPVSEQILSNRCRGSAGTTKRLVSIGRLSEQKQFCILIGVFAALSARHPAWSLHIFGEGHLRFELERQVSELGQEGRVMLPGLISNVGEVLAESDIFVMTSKYEGFPNALLEAMAVGLPCVAFDCPSGPREMSMDGEVVSLVPAGDRRALEQALEKLMLDGGIRQTLGRSACASVVDRYSLNAVLEKWDALFDELGIIR